MSSPAPSVCLSFVTKLSTNGTAIEAMKATHDNLIARLNIAPMAFSVRNKNFVVTPNDSNGIVISAMVKNSIFVMKSSNAVMNRQYVNITMPMMAMRRTPRLSKSMSS